METNVQSKIVGVDDWVAIQAKSGNISRRLQLNATTGRADIFTSTNDWEDYEPIKILTRDDLPLKANVWQLESNGRSDSFSYSQSCLIFASRGDSYGVYMCDNWEVVATIHNLEDVSVSVSNHTVTVTNNRSSGAIGVIVIGNTNLSY